MRPAGLLLSVVVPACGVIVCASACTREQPAQSTYFERTIAPILEGSCSRSSTGAACHVANAKGNAFGNLDTTTYAMLSRRRDLLLDHGPYGQPAFLLKNVEPYPVEISTSDDQRVTVTVDVRHGGGSILDPSGSAYRTLRRWIQSGATENNAGLPPAVLERQPCTTIVPRHPGFDPAKPASADFATFVDRVAPVLRASCAAGNCHGTPSNDLLLTCGDTPDGARWNHFAASEYLAKDPEKSELLRRPLSPAQGGAFHEGAVVFPSAGDAGYVALLDWARQRGPASTAPTDAGFAFFAAKVQPVLAKKGCMQVQCHSSAMFHDYRLRGGSGGSFSVSATRRNYELSLAQLSLESDDPGVSRLVRKNLYRPEVCSTSGCDRAAGIAHRGGALLEDFAGNAASPEACDKATPAFDYDKGDVDKIPAYCILYEWLRRERAARPLDPLSAIAFVRRPVAPGPDRAQDFDVYRPGADLLLVKATLAGGAVTLAGAATSVTASCGLDKTSADIRRPAVSWSGRKIAFAARASATEPLVIYEMNADGSGCGRQPDTLKKTGSENGLLVHSFDPAYAPDDRLLFASTRGNVATGPYDYEGPQRSPADLSKPNANLYVLEPDPAAVGARRVRQLTFLLDMEREPGFMSDGRVILTAEKRAPGFRQLALRRVNLDGGDYHPLYAQRPSIGYAQATDVVELSDRNFAAIFSDPALPHRGGALGVFNRSIGVDFQSRTPGDYLLDPSVIDPSAPASPEPGFFLRSLRFPDATASGRPREPTTGVYASPRALAGGKILVSFGAATDAATFGGDFDLWVLDPARGTKVKLLGDAGVAEIDAAPVFARANRGVYASSLDEPNGHTQIHEGKAEADITLLSGPVLASLLFQNTPTGRPVEELKEIAIYEALPPPVTQTSVDADPRFAVTDEHGKVYVRRRLLGRVPLAADGSARFQVPGGLPLVLQVPETKASREKKSPRTQRETISFAPGEYAHQSFRPAFFDGFCGGCHGAASGKAIDVGVTPDVLTQASSVLARSGVAVNLNVAPGRRGAVEGAPGR